MSAKPAKSTEKLAIGIDLGGTQVRAALVTREGRIVAQEQRPTPATEGRYASPAALVQAMADCSAPLFEQADILGVGVGSGGQFNPRSGVMLSVHTGDPAFINVPIAAMLSQQLGAPVFIDNDVKAAALAELQLGAGRGYQHLICVAVGTFIGGALVMDGRIVHGAQGLAGHLGQLLDYETGTYIENIAGGVALAQRAFANGLLEPGQTTVDLFAKAESGHDEVARFIADAGRKLGVALAGLAHALQPEVILVGGSVGLQPRYIDAINAGLQAHLMPNWQSIRAIPMQLGTDAGKIGAALRVYNELAP